MNDAYSENFWRARAERAEAQLAALRTEVMSLKAIADSRSERIAALLTALQDTGGGADSEPSSLQGVEMIWSLRDDRGGL